MTKLDQDIQDPAYNDGTRNLDDPQPETHLTIRNICNPGVTVGQEENTAQTKGKSGPAMENAAEVSPTAGNDWIEPGPSVEELPPANCHDYSRPKRVIRRPDRYGDWEFNTITSSDYPLILRNKIATFRTFAQEQKNRALRLKSDYMSKVQQLRKQGLKNVELNLKIIAESVDYRTVTLSIQLLLKQSEHGTFRITGQ